MTATQKHFRTCNLCEAMCGLEIDYHENKVIAIKGDKEDPFSQGYICPKAVALQDIYEDPNRLKKPMERTASGWKEISWETAFDKTVAGIQAVQKKYGHDAVGIYQGNPSVHNYGTMMSSPQFTRALGTKNRFSATSADQLPHHMSSQLMFGHSLVVPIPDIDHTDFFLVLGANPVASNGSLMTAPGMPNRIKALQQRGGKMIVVDPRKSETALKADAHHYIKPGTDIWFLLSMVHVILKQDQLDVGKLSQLIANFDLLKVITDDYSPENTETITGIPAKSIYDIAKAFVSAESAVCYGRIGVSTQQHGSSCTWLINVINIITGNFDKKGGSMMTLPAVDLVNILGPRGTQKRFNRWQSRIRQLPEFGGELPVVCLAEEILEPGEGQIKAMITNAGNPVLSTPDGTQLDKAFDSLEFMVAIDIYLNETTRHANIILPPTTGLETDHYDLIFSSFAVRNVAKYSPALFEPAKDAKSDWEIFEELTQRLTGNSAKQSKNKPPRPQRLLNIALSLGPYGYKHKHLTVRKNEASLDLALLKNKPHGLDLGPLQPLMPFRLFTADKKIDLAPDMMVKSIKALPAVEPGNKNDKAFDLLLIGRRQLRSNNSWMHNSHRLVKGKERCTLLMHPQDVQKQGLADQQLVEISSRVGCVKIKLEVSEDIMPGVVSIPHGWGHSRKGTHLEVAQQHPGASINDLTDTQLIDAISGNAAFSGVPVMVKPLMN